MHVIIKRVDDENDDIHDDENGDDYEETATYFNFVSSSSSS